MCSGCPQRQASVDNLSSGHHECQHCNVISHPIVLELLQTKVMSSLRSYVLSPVKYPRLSSTPTLTIPLFHMNISRAAGWSPVYLSVSLCLLSNVTKIRSGPCKDPFYDCKTLHTDVCAFVLCSHRERIWEQLNCAAAINRVMECGSLWCYCHIIVSPSCQRESFVKLFYGWNRKVSLYSKLCLNLDSFSLCL